MIVASQKVALSGFRGFSNVSKHRLTPSLRRLSAQNVAARSSASPESHLATTPPTTTVPALSPTANDGAVGNDQPEGSVLLEVLTSGMEGGETAAPASEAEVTVEEETYEDVEEIIEQKVVTIDVAGQRSFSFLTGTRIGHGVLMGVLGVLLATLLVAAVNVYKRATTKTAVRKRQVNTNMQLVEMLNAYLPDKRGQLTSSVVRGMRSKTGFTPVEVFRKYLWWLLRERKFDSAAVEDLVALKAALSLSDDDVAAAIKERSGRVYEKYGTLMLNTEGMTSEGVQRKATCQALFSKLLYLTEYEPLISQRSLAAQEVDLKQIFGATPDDVAKLRIVSLYDVDIEKLDRMMQDKSE